MSQLEAKASAALRAELDRELADFPTVEVQDQASLKEQINGQFDRVFGFIYALLALAVIVEDAGVLEDGHRLVLSAVTG